MRGVRPQRTFCSLVAFLNDIVELGLAEDTPKWFEYVGQALAEMLLRARGGEPNILTLKELWQYDDTYLVQPLLGHTLALIATRDQFTPVDGDQLQRANVVSSGLDRLKAVWRMGGANLTLKTIADQYENAVDKVLPEKYPVLVEFRPIALTGEGCDVDEDEDEDAPIMITAGSQRLVRHSLIVR